MANSPSLNAATGNASFVTADGMRASTDTTLRAIFSDDFGGSAVDTTKWDVIDGGLAANPTLNGYSAVQGAIGTGITGITDAVASSVLTVSLGTTTNAERWYLSKQTFSGKEDILVLLSRSQPLTQNSLFIGLVEVDPVTLIPYLNPNFTKEFTNRGGCEFALTATTTAYQAEAVADSSPSKASGAIGVAATMTAVQEYLIEVDSRDITVSSATIDSATAKLAGASRVSSQCPNDNKLYKLIMRFRNVGTPATNTNFAISRILVVDNFEQRVQISSAEGDNFGSKALAVNVLSSAALTASLNPSTSLGPATYHKLTAAATTNATSVKTTAAILTGGYIRNRAAAERYLKFYNKASAPTVGTDVPFMTIGIPAASFVGVHDIVGAYGARFSVGLAYATTVNYADADTTALTASDMDINLIYS